MLHNTLLFLLSASMELGDPLFQIVSQERSGVCWFSALGFLSVRPPGCLCRLLSFFASTLVCYYWSGLTDFKSCPFCLLRDLGWWGEWLYVGFPGASASEGSACNVGDLSSIPGLGRSPWEGYGNPLQYSCLENPMEYHGVAESRTRRSDFHFQWVYACGYFSTLFASTFYILSLLLIMKSLTTKHAVGMLFLF